MGGGDYLGVNVVECGNHSGLPSQAVCSDVKPVRVGGLQVSHPPGFVRFPQNHIVFVDRVEDGDLHVLVGVVCGRKMLGNGLILGPLVDNVTSMAIHSLMERLPGFAHILDVAFLALNEVDAILGFAVC